MDLVVATVAKGVAEAATETERAAAPAARPVEPAETREGGVAMEAAPEAAAWAAAALVAESLGSASGADSRAAAARWVARTRSRGQGRCGSCRSYRQLS